MTLYELFAVQRDMNRLKSLYMDGMRNDALNCCGKLSSVSKKYRKTERS